MAEANPVTVANRILETLDSLPAPEIGSLNGVAGELKKLKAVVSTLLGVLNDATTRAGESPELRAWLKEVADVLLDGDEIVDELRTEKVWLSLSVSRQFLFRLNKGRKLVRLTKKLAELAEKNRSFNLFRQVVHASVAARAREIISTRPFGEETCVYGRDKDKEMLMQILLGSEIDETVSVISVVGMRGLGKTTLAQLVFSDARVETHFVLRLWVNVAGDFDLIRIADDIIKSATGRRLENPEIELEKQLAGRSFILVLDDVRDIDPGRWLALKRLLMGGAEGSRVLITTRIDMVATMIGTISSYKLIGLSMESSRALFKHVVFSEKDLKSRVVIEELAKEVVDICNDSENKDVFEELAKVIVDKCNDTVKRKAFEELAKEIVDKRNDLVKKEAFEELPKKIVDNFNDSKKREVFKGLAKEIVDNCSDLKKREVFKELAMDFVFKCNDSKKRKVFGELVKEIVDKCNDSKKREVLEELANEIVDTRNDSVNKKAFEELAKGIVNNCIDSKKKEVFEELAKEIVDKLNDSVNREVFEELAKEIVDQCNDSKKREACEELVMEIIDKWNDSKIKKMFEELAKNIADKCVDSKKREVFEELSKEIVDTCNDSKKRVGIEELAKEIVDKCNDSANIEGFKKLAMEIVDKCKDSKKREVFEELAKEIIDKSNDSANREVFEELTKKIVDKFYDSKKREVFEEFAKKIVDKCKDSKTREVFAELAKKIVVKCNDLRIREMFAELAKEIVVKCNVLRIREVFVELAKKIVVNCDVLFTREAFEELAKDIVDKCNGNPLTLKTIGNILRSKNTTEEWLSFKDGGLHLLTKQDGDIPPELKLSYNDLPPHLKDCFAYCSLFPKNYEIDVSTLIKFWVAQGFTMNHGNSTQLSEEIGYQYFEDLVRRGFFKIVETTGTTTKCKMAEAVHDDLAKFVAGKECLKLDLGGQYIFVRRRIHHVSFDFPLPLLRRIPINLEPVKRIRSLVFFPNQQSGKYEGSSNQAICDAIVSNFKSLRTLDLHHSGIKTVPPYIDSLKHLRYLDLSRNAKIKVLPNSITKLLNLQTLKLSSCIRLQELPRDIKKLVNLRHLEIDGCYNLTHMPSGMGELRDLQTLSQFVLSKGANSVSGRSGELRELGTLNNLRGDLQIRNLRHDHDVRDICLKEKQGLQSLTLHWSVGAMGLDDEKLLEGGLGECINLQRLAFKGYGGAKLPNWLSTSQYLGKLELRRCSECTFLPPLHCCPSLETLVLDDMTKLEYVAEDHVVKDVFFPCLKELRLTELPMLKGWWKSTSPEVNHEVPVFPILSKLFIEDCPQLDSMPLFPNLDEGLVLDSTSWKPFQQTMNKADHASSSSSSSSSPLSGLRNLSIIGIEELNNDDVSEIKWERLARLQFLRLDYLPNLESLPDGLQSITSLQELHIWRCNFTAIPDWISELKSLKKLSIWVCPNMESLPETIRSMNSLLTLEIEDCPTLLHRCQRKAGADWVKISRIPDLRLDRMSRR